MGRGMTRRAAAAALVCAAASAAACSARTADGAASSSPAAGAAASAPSGAEPGEVDEADPDSVADAVAVSLSVRDARTDATSQTAQTRAARWYGGDLAAAAAATGETELARPSRRWAMMQSKGAWDVVDSIDRRMDDPVPDSETMARRQRAVTVHAQAEDGWSGLVSTSRYWLVLTRDDGVWRVTGLRASTDG